MLLFASLLDFEQQPLEHTLAIHDLHAQLPIFEEQMPQHVHLDNWFQAGSLKEDHTLVSLLVVLEVPLVLGWVLDLGYRNKRVQIRLVSEVWLLLYLIFSNKHYDNLAFMSRNYTLKFVGILLGKYLHYLCCHNGLHLNDCQNSQIHIQSRTSHLSKKVVDFGYL